MLKSYSQNPTDLQSILKASTAWTLIALVESLRALKSYRLPRWTPGSTEGLIKIGQKGF